MSLDGPLLAMSFAQVRSREPHFGMRFYERIEATQPELAELFVHTPKDQQAHRLEQALHTIVSHIEHAPELVEDTLRDLGARHVDYGVQDDMFGPVGACLLETLRAAAGPGWTRHHERAWSEAYARIAELMIEGARSERARRVA